MFLSTSSWLTIQKHLSSLRRWSFTEGLSCEGLSRSPVLLVGCLLSYHARCAGRGMVHLTTGLDVLHRGAVKSSYHIGKLSIHNIPPAIGIAGGVHTFPLALQATSWMHEKQKQTLHRVRWFYGQSLQTLSMQEGWSMDTHWAPKWNHYLGFTPAEACMSLWIVGDYSLFSRSHFFTGTGATWHLGLYRQRGKFTTVLTGILQDAALWDY